MTATSRAARTVALTAFATYFVLLALATAVQPPGYRSTRDYISGLAAMDATAPALMITGFLVAAVEVAATAYLLWDRLRSGWARAAVTLMAVAAAAMAVAGLARFDCGRNDAACRAQLEAGMSGHSQLHGLAALAVFLPLILASFLLAVAIYRSRWPHRGRLALLALTGGVAQLALTVAVEEQLTAAPGLMQRAAVVLLLGLPLLLATRRPDPAPVSPAPRVAEPVG